MITWYTLWNDYIFSASSLFYFFFVFIFSFPKLHLSSWLCSVFLDFSAASLAFPYPPSILKLGRNFFLFSLINWAIYLPSSDNYAAFGRKVFSFLMFILVQKNNSWLLKKSIKLHHICSLLAPFPPQAMLVIWYICFQCYSPCRYRYI